MVRPETRLKIRRVAALTAALALICAVTRAQTPATPQAPGALDGPRVTRAVESAARVIAAEYFDPAVGANTSTTLLERLAAGRYGAPIAARDLASALTRDLYELTRDKHLAVTVTPPTIPAKPAGPSPSAPVNTREAAGRRSNFGVRKVEVLDGNIGLLDITFFYRPNEAGDSIAAAMRLLQYADTLILDLRDNGGGSPDTVALVCGYLLDRPGTPLFDIVARGGQRTAYTTPDVAPRSGSRPIFVLTSARTFSGGEGLAFVLQELGRATVVGEQTPGAANPGRPYPIDEGFEVTVPNGQVRTSKSGRNWEGTGVTPDVVVPASNALAAAVDRARALAGR